MLQSWHLSFNSNMFAHSIFALTFGPFPEYFTDSTWSLTNWSLRPGRKPTICEHCSWFTSHHCTIPPHSNKVNCESARGPYFWAYILVSFTFYGSARLFQPSQVSGQIRWPPTSWNMYLLPQGLAYSCESYFNHNIPPAFFTGWNLCFTNLNWNQHMQLNYGCIIHLCTWTALNFHTVSIEVSMYHT